MGTLAQWFSVSVVALALGGCGGMGGLYGHDEFSNYTARKDTITTSAGDQKEVNRATHADDPWPRYVEDRQIDVNGDRATRAVECYRLGQARPTGGTTTVSSAQTTTNGNVATTTGTAQSSPTMSKGC